MRNCPTCKSDKPAQFFNQGGPECDLCKYINSEIASGRRFDEAVTRYHWEFSDELPDVDEPAPPPKALPVVEGPRIPPQAQAYRAKCEKCGRWVYPYVEPYVGGRGTECWLPAEIAPFMKVWKPATR